jgi:hypothetical protein
MSRPDLALRYPISKKTFAVKKGGQSTAAIVANICGLYGRLLNPKNGNFP